MSDFREMVARHKLLKNEKRPMTTVHLAKPRTHVENTQMFFDAVHTDIIEPIARKAIASPVFELPYGADSITDPNHANAEFYR